MMSKAEFNKIMIDEMIEQLQLSKGVVDMELLEWLEARIKDLRHGPQYN